MYAIYLNDYERIIAVENNLWIAHPAAKLLSSKLSLCICEMPDNIIINNTTCLKWKISTPELPLSIQYPKLIIPESFQIIEVGYPDGVDPKTLTDCQEFVLKVLKILSSSKTTDAMLNTGDRQYFQDLLDFDFLSSASDESGIEQGFLKSIEKILYLSNTVEEIDIKINQLFESEKSKFPRNTVLYKKTFLHYLNA